MKAALVAFSSFLFLIGTAQAVNNSICKQLGSYDSNRKCAPLGATILSGGPGVQQITACMCDWEVPLNTDAILLNNHKKAQQLITDYGAICDTVSGTTDNWLAIQKTADASFFAKGEMVIPPCGNPWMMSRSLVISSRTCSGDTIRPGGMCLADSDCTGGGTCNPVSPTSELDFSVIGSATTTGSDLRPLNGSFIGAGIIMIGDGTNLMSRWSVRRLGLHCTGGPGSLNGIVVKNSAEWAFVENQVGGCNIGFQGIGATVQVGVIDRCIFGSADLIGIDLNIASSIRITNSHISEGPTGGGSTSRGIHCASCGPRMVIDHNQMNDWSGDFAIRIDQAAGIDGGGIISNNDIQDVKGCIFNGVKSAVISGNHCSDNKASASEAFHMEQVSDVVVSHNIVKNWTTTGAIGFYFKGSSFIVDHNEAHGLPATSTGFDCDSCTVSTFDHNRVVSGAPLNGFRERGTSGTNTWDKNNRGAATNGYTGIASTSRVEGCIATDAPTTALGQNCGVSPVLTGTCYYDLSLDETCVCGNAAATPGTTVWCQLDGGGCNTNASCG